MSPAETTVHALAAAMWPGRIVRAHVAPRCRTKPEWHYIHCGRTLYDHRTLGTGATEAEAWADAEARCRREINDAIDRERRDRDRAEAEIARLTAALVDATLRRLRGGL